MMTLLAVPFALVAGWLVYEALWQAGAPFRFRALALAGFLLVVTGVYVHQTPVIVVGLIGFVVGEGVSTLYTRGRDHVGWTAPMPKQVASRKKGRRRRGQTSARPLGQVSEPEFADAPPPFEYAAPGAAAEPGSAPGDEFDALGLGVGLGDEWGASADATLAGGTRADELTDPYGQPVPVYGPGADAYSTGERTQVFAYGDDAGSAMDGTQVFAYGNAPEPAGTPGGPPRFDEPAEAVPAAAAEWGTADWPMLPADAESAATGGHVAAPAYDADAATGLIPPQAAPAAAGYTGYGPDPEDPLFGAYNPSPAGGAAPSRQWGSYSEYANAPAQGAPPAESSPPSGDWGSSPGSYGTGGHPLRPDPLFADPLHPAGYALGSFAADPGPISSFAADSYGTGGYPGGAPQPPALGAEYGSGPYASGTADAYPYGAEPYGAGEYGAHQPAAHAPDASSGAAAAPGHQRRHPDEEWRY